MLGEGPHREGALYIGVDHNLHLLQGLSIPTNNGSGPPKGEIEFFLHLPLQIIQIVDGLLVHLHGVVADHGVLLRHLFLHALDLLPMIRIPNRIT